MENPKLYGTLIFAVLLLLFFNGMLSRDIYNWVPSIKKKIFLYLLLWLVPVAGFFLVNKFGNLGWFRKGKTDNSRSVISGGFLGADSVLNPGAKHRIEMIERQKSEIHHEDKQAGEGGDNKKKKA